MENVTIPQVLLISLIGLSVVFCVLIVLMAFIKIMSLIVGAAEKKAKNETKPESQNEEKRLAKGSCGEVCMFDVPDRIAAMAMAIVADEMQVPLNELRFISIKEVGENK